MNTCLTEDNYVCCYKCDEWMCCCICWDVIWTVIWLSVIYMVTSVHVKYLKCVNMWIYLDVCWIIDELIYVKILTSGAMYDVERCVLVISVLWTGYCYICTNKMAHVCVILICVMWLCACVWICVVCSVYTPYLQIELRWDIMY